MKQWFTVEQIDCDTFAISEYGHWEEMHSYLLCGKESALLIDTGLGVSNLKNVTDELTKFPITVVTTHVHWDHIGGHKWYDRIAVHESEAAWLSESFPLPISVVKSSLTKHPCDFPDDFNIDDYAVFKGEPQLILQDGDTMEIGDRSICVVHTPGHSPGHCCFYEPGREYLYTGDLVYEGCLDIYYPTTNPIHFLHSVNKIREYPVKRILPGHHRLDIGVALIEKTADALEALRSEGKLEHGAGIFDFGSFQIHV